MESPELLLTANELGLTQGTVTQEPNLLPCSSSSSHHHHAPVFGARWLRSTPGTGLLGGVTISSLERS